MQCTSLLIYRGTLTAAAFSPDRPTQSSVSWPRSPNLTKCISLCQKHSNTQIHKYKNTKIQKYKNTKIQKYKKQIHKWKWQLSKSGIPDTDKWRLLSVSEGPQDREVLGRFLSIYDIEFNPDSAELCDFFTVAIVIKNYSQVWRRLSSDKCPVTRHWQIASEHPTWWAAR